MFAKVGHPRLSVSFATLSLIILLPAAVQAADPRAGTVKWPAGAFQVDVVFTKPMPGDKYSVAVMPFVPKLGGYSTTTVCTYFGLIRKTPDWFTVQHKRCDSGAAVKTDETFQLDWIAAEWTQ